MTPRYIVALALLVALIAGIGSAPPLARADVDGSVAIGCEFLAGAIDGNPNDVPDSGDIAAACDGLITEADAANLANALGDQDNTLERADFAAIDLDANQIEADATPAGNTRAFTYIFAIVDDDWATTFSTDARLSVNFGVDGVCSTLAEDADCDASVLGDGDGVVVATMTVAAGASAGDEVEVTIVHEGDDTTIEMITVTGPPTQIELESTSGTGVETNAVPEPYATCVAGLDARAPATFTAQAAQTAVLGIRATVRDSGGSELTRVPVVIESGNNPRLPVPPTFASNTGVSVAGYPGPGFGYFALLCGAAQAGPVALTATINDGTPAEEIDTAFFDVVAPGAPGPPAQITPEPAIASVQCNGAQSSTLVAIVKDAADRPVADGTAVSFSVVAGGVASPVNTTTVVGIASTEITPDAGQNNGLIVQIAAGDVQAEAYVFCENDGDDSALPLDVYSLPFSDFRITTGMTHESGDPQPCGSIGADIWYQLTLVPSPPFNGTLIVNTAGSNFSTVVAAYVHTGGGAPTVAGSTLIDCDATGADSSVTFDAAAGNTYFFQVGGVGGATGGLQFNIECGDDNDCDTVLDATDNCPNDPNVSQINTDRAPIVTPGVGPIDTTIANGDAQGDACDPDDDNDGLTDDDEVTGAPCASATGTTNPLLFDTDGDRTGDGAECGLGSNPNSALSKPASPMPGDTDHDGLPNALETSIGSNPAMVDTDGDGVNDGVEFRGYGSFAAVLDSDGDACADDTEIADVTGSRKVDVVDIFLVAGSFGLTTRPNLDISKDGSINIVDLFLIAGNTTQGFCPVQ